MCHYAPWALTPCPLKTNVKHEIKPSAFHGGLLFPEKGYPEQTVNQVTPPSGQDATSSSARASVRSAAVSARQSPSALLERRCLSARAAATGHAPEPAVTATLLARPRLLPVCGRRESIPPDRPHAGPWLTAETPPDRTLWAGVFASSPADHIRQGTAHPCVVQDPRGDGVSEAHPRDDPHFHPLRESTDAQTRPSQPLKPDFSPGPTVGLARR